MTCGHAQEKVAARSFDVRKTMRMDDGSNDASYAVCCMPRSRTLSCTHEWVKRAGTATRREFYSADRTDVDIASSCDARSLSTHVSLRKLSVLDGAAFHATAVLRYDCARHLRYRAHAV